MFETLRTYVKSLLEQEQNEEQEIRDLFQHWIDEYKASYLTYRKKVQSDSWVPTQISIKKTNNFITILPDFEESERNDWSILTFNKKNNSIYCINTQALTSALAPSVAAALTATLISASASTLAYYVEQGWVNKISVDQFRRVMDVTKGNYIQFEALTSRLSEMNKKNANV